MRHEDFAEVAAQAMNFPNYEEGAFDDYLCDYHQLCEKYGPQEGLRLALLALTLSTAVAGTPSNVHAQDVQPPEGYEIEVPDVDPFFASQNLEITSDEVFAAGAPEELYIETIDDLIDQIKKGLSSKEYILRFSNEDTKLIVEMYLRENDVFISTGNAVSSLDAETVANIFGENFLFILQNDTQGVRNVNETRVFHNTLQGVQPPSAPLSTTQIINHPDGLVQTTSVITDTDGSITKTVKYNAPWTYNAGKTLTGDMLASGRMFLAGKPTFMIPNDEDPDKFIVQNIYVLYTGGYTTESGLFVPNFEHKPIFEKDLFNFHGEVIAANIGAITSESPNIVLISADALTYANNQGLPFKLAKILYEARQNFGADYELFITESISGASQRHNELAVMLENSGIDYRSFIRTFGSAGNNNKILTVDTIDPNYLVQVLALNSERTALSRYTNYGLDPSLYLAERGDFDAITPVISGDGTLVYLPRKYTGTSMATPIMAAQGVVNAGRFGIELPTMPILFPDMKDIIYQGEINGGSLARTVRVITDSQLNSILSANQSNGIIPPNASILFDGNWSALNGRFNKADYISNIGMSWDDFLRLPANSALNLNMPFIDFYKSPVLPEVYAALYTGGASSTNAPQRILYWNSPEAIARIASLDFGYIDVPNLKVNPITYSLRIGNGSLPNFDNLDTSTYAFNAKLLQENFDSEFASFETEDANGIVQKIFFPIVLSSN